MNTDFGTFHYRSPLFISLLSLCLLFSNSCQQSLTGGKKPFEGVITYQIEYDKMPKGMEGLEKMLPTKRIVSIKGSKNVIEEQAGIGGKRTIIIDKAKDSYIVQMEVLHKTAHAKHSRNEVLDYEMGSCTYTGYLKDTREIQGYKCKHAQLAINHGADSVNVYFTKKIKTNSMMPYPGLLGYPLYFEAIRKNVPMRFTAVSVEPKPLPDSLFVPSDKSREVNLQTFRRMFGGI